MRKPQIHTIYEDGVTVTRYVEDLSDIELVRLINDPTITACNDDPLLTLLGKQIVQGMLRQRRGCI